MVSQIRVKDIVHAASRTTIVFIVMSRARDPRTIRQYMSLSTWVLIPKNETRQDGDDVPAIVHTRQVGVLVDVLCEGPVTNPRCSVSDGVNGNVWDEEREVQTVQDGDSGSERVPDRRHFAICGLG